MKKRLLAVTVLLGTIVCIAAGCGKKDPQTATLVLDSNPTTGFTWEMTQTNPIFDMTSEYVPDSMDEGIVGAGGKETFKLTPKEKGETTVTFEYAQHWEGGEKGQTISYDIKVDKNLQIEVQAMRAELEGDIDHVPDSPELTIE